LEVEVAELDEAVRRESDAVEAMKKKRAQEIERGRAEIMGDTYREAPRSLLQRLSVHGYRDYLY
jgi:hypothetical protein